MSTARQIVSFGSGGRVFNFRAAAVIVHGGRVLLHHAEMEDFWSLPGGRIELMEDARAGLRREMAEELGEDVEVGRLLWVAENFFQFQGRDYHEMGMYFETALGERSELAGREGEWWLEEDNGIKICFRWFAVERAPELPIVPGFLREGLGALPAATEHVVYRDGRVWGQGSG